MVSKSKRSGSAKKKAAARGAVRRRRDPTKPKRALNKIALFNKDNYARVKKQNPGWESTDVFRELSQLWKQLDPEDQAVYERKAQKELKASATRRATWKADKKKTRKDSEYNVFVRQFYKNLPKTRPDLVRTENDSVSQGKAKFKKTAKEVGAAWQSYLQTGVKPKSASRSRSRSSSRSRSRSKSASKKTRSSSKSKSASKKRKSSSKSKSASKKRKSSSKSKSASKKRKSAKSKSKSASKKKSKSKSRTSKSKRGYDGGYNHGYNDEEEETVYDMDAADDDMIGDDELTMMMDN